MAKRGIGLSLLLSILICTLLVLQLNGFTFADEEALADAEQTLAIHHKKSGFFIKQTITGLPEGSHDVFLPTNAQNIMCESQAGGECEWMPRAGKIKTTGTGVILTYHLPSPKRGEHYVMADWAVGITGLESSFTRVQLTEKTWRTGSWVAEADSVGRKKMDEIDYYVFESPDGIPVLYWQKRPLVKTFDSESMTVYTEKDVPVNSKVLEHIQLDDKLFVAAVHVTRIVKKENLLLVPREKTVEEQVVRYYLDQYYSFENPLLKELVIALVAESEPKDKQARKMIESLSSALRKEEMENWLENIFAAKTKVTGQWLDKAIEEATGSRTDFFESNAKPSASFHPFRFIDKREIMVNGRRDHHIQLKLRNEQTYLQFQPLAEALGYQVILSEKKDEVILKRGGTSYQFNYQRKIFLMNGETYGFKEVPFLKEDGKVYIQKAEASKLFHIVIKGTDRAVFINEDSP